MSFEQNVYILISLPEEDLANIITFEHTEHPPAASKLNSNLSQLTPGVKNNPTAKAYHNH